VEQEAKNRAELRAEREAFAALLVPVVVLAAAGVVGVLTLANVRQRRAEIGILRRLGVRSSQVLTLVLGKRLLTGCSAAVWGSVGWAAWLLRRRAAAVPFDPAAGGLGGGWGRARGGAGGVAAGAMAARQDPAEILREE
jgi:ABC-type lipoprotein release transport system permease subunit